MNEKPKCGKCGGGLRFVRWSRRRPAKSEALAVCSRCGEKWQVRYFQGRQTSDPYQVRDAARKSARGSWRLEDGRAAAMVALYGSVQAFLDHAPLVCMSLQAKQ